MARATGSINYLEHRTPLKDESGKYQIHPMFVKQDVVDREKMEKRVRDHCAMNVSSFISALETLEDETLYRTRNVSKETCQSSAVPCVPYLSLLGIPLLWGTGYACGNGCTFSVNGDAAKYVGCSVCLHLLSVDVRQN